MYSFFKYFLKYNFYYMNNLKIVNLRKYLKKNLLGGSSSSNHLVIPAGTTEITEQMVPKSTTSVTIPDSVQIISFNAFQNTQLTDVTIPNSVTTIGNSAFYNTQLANITIPDSVTTIGNSAFERTQLTNVTIGNSVTTIGNSAFFGTQLTNVTIGNSVTTIGNYAFANTPLTNVTIPDSVQSISFRAFNNTQLTYVTIPADTTIRENTFDDNVIINRVDINAAELSTDDPNHLIIPAGTTEITEEMVPKSTTSVTIPDSVTTIGNYAFQNTQLTNVTIPNSVQSIGTRAFKNTQLTNVTIPDSVTTIGDYAFFSTQLTNVTIPDSVITIGNYAFEETQLTNVTIGNSVTTIGDYAFYETQLTNVTIGNSVTTIGEFAFAYTQLTNVTIPDSVITIGDYAFYETQLTNVTIGNSVTTIGDHAFADTKLTNVTIPDSVQSIGFGAFNNTQLTNVTIPANTTIKENTFDDNVIINRVDINAAELSTDDPNHLFIPAGTTEITEDMVPKSTTSVTIPNSVQSIGFRAFAETPLTNVTIPNSVKTIDQSAFFGTQLTNVTIGNSVTTIGDYAFADTQLTNVTIGNSVIFIGNKAFENTKLTNVTIPDSVQSIGFGAFKKTQLTNVTIGNSVTTIGDYAFADTQLTNVTIGNSVIFIGNKAFENTKLTNVTIPDSVQSIGFGAFKKTQLTNVTIGNSVTTIGDYAFADTQLTNVTIPDSVQSIGFRAFMNTKLTNVTIPANTTIKPSTFDDNVIINRVHSIDTFLQSLPKMPLTADGKPKRETIEIKRDNVLNSIFAAKQYYKEELFNKDVYIQFVGEDGIDCGGLKRDFFTLLGDEIIKKYFFEDEGNYCIIKNEDSSGEATIPINDYYFIGQLFAYCIKVKANINIRLHPVLLHMILNSTYSNPIVDIRNTKGHEILSLINGRSDYDTKLNLILNYINKELKYQDRKTLNMDTLQEIVEIMDNYDFTISNRMPLGRYFTILKMSEEDWNDAGNEKSLCLSEAGMLCSLFDDQIEIPFEKKEWFIDFIIGSYIYGKTLDETENFIRGFHNIIQPELLRGLSPKDLNTLIAGNSTIDIDMFLAGVDFINVEDKLDLIHGIIRKYAEEDPTYLNEFLYWITGKKTLPHDGFKEFGRQLEVRFRGEFDIEDGRIASHTCSSFVYVELPHNLLVDESTETSKSKLEQALSKVMIQSYSEGTYNLAGGGNRITLLKNFI